MSRVRNPAYGARLHGGQGWLMAKYLIDVNLPRVLSHWAGDGFEYVMDFDPRWPDVEIWNYALKCGSTIVSKDADFSDRIFVHKNGPRVIHLRIGNMTFPEMELFFTARWKDICLLSARHQLVTVYRDRVECIT